MFRQVEITPPWIPPTEEMNPSANRAVSIAESEAIRLKHDYIGAEHLLLGILSLDEGIACSSLKSQGMTPDKLRTDAKYQTGSGRKTPRFTPTMMKIIPMGIAKAKSSGQDLATPENLFEAIIEEGQNIAILILDSMKVDTGAVQKKIRK